MWYDGLMLVILAYTTIRGAAKGMAWQLAAIAAMVLCFVFATPLSLVVAPAINLAPPLNRWVAMLGIYLAFSFGCFSVARLLRGWLEAIKFTEYDRHLGALFGLLKGITLCLVITFFAVCLSETACHAIMQTRSGYLAGETLEQLAVVMPAELQTVLKPHLRHFDEDHLAHNSNSTDSAADSIDDADPWSARDSDSFRGSSRQEEDRFEESDLSSQRDDQPAPDGGTAPARGFVGQAVDAIEDKLKAGVKKWINDVVNPKSNGTQAPAASAEGDVPGNRPLSDRRPSSTADTLPTLIDAVSRLFATTPQKQAEHRSQIEALLQGIPAPISAAALRDWRADLLGSAADPDPETDAGTSLDRRLLRQLKAAGSSPDDLPRPLRERLREAESE